MNECQHDVAKPNHTLYLYEPDMKGYCGTCDIEVDYDFVLRHCSDHSVLPNADA